MTVQDLLTHLAKMPLDAEVKWVTGDPDGEGYLGQEIHACVLDASGHTVGLSVVGLDALQTELTEVQADRELLTELAGYANALRDRMAAAYDGPTTRAVIVEKLRTWYDARLASSSENPNG